jgi:hypothetical protein
MIKLYKRTMDLLKLIASKNYECCPDCNEYEQMILEARAVLEEIDKL